MVVNSEWAAVQFRPKGARGLNGTDLACNIASP